MNQLRVIAVALTIVLALRPVGLHLVIQYYINLAMFTFLHFKGESIFFYERSLFRHALAGEFVTVCLMPWLLVFADVHDLNKQMKHLVCLILIASNLGLMLVSITILIIPEATMALRGIQALGRKTANALRSVLNGINNTTMKASGKVFGVLEPMVYMAKDKARDIRLNREQKK